MPPTPEHTNLVSFALSGNYDVNKPVLIDAVDPSRSISKACAVKLISELAGSFKADSTVCLHLPNDITYPILTLAVYASQCRWTGANTAYTRFELEHMFRTAEVSYVVTRVEDLEKVEQAVKASDTGAEIILYSDILAESSLKLEGELTSPVKEDSVRGSSEFTRHHDLHNLLSLGRLRKSAGDGDLDSRLLAINPESIAALMTTSGTTGRPKMAARTHNSMIVEALANEDNNLAKPYCIRRLLTTPIFHAFSMPDMIFNSLRLGHEVYFMPRFIKETFVSAIWRYDINETFAPPPILLILLNEPDCHPQLQPLRAVFTGGATLSPALAKNFRALFRYHHMRIVQTWGMTEGGWFASTTYPEETDSRCHVGRALPGLQVRMSHATTTELDDDTRAGEIEVHGPQVMREYFGDPNATKAAFTPDGWLRTGDVGYIRNHKIYLISRAKDLIKVNGFQVAPAEIEDACLAHPSVSDVGAVRAGEGTSEHPVAFVVVKVGCTLAVDAIKKFLLERLARYKSSTCEIRFIESIPKSGAGKILRRELEQLL